MKEFDPQKVAEALYRILADQLGVDAPEVKVSKKENVA